MGTILSIQSHVAYGYVGNRAATLPLQIMGHEVTAINTVQFSNHTGYGNWTGAVFPSGHIRDVLKGLTERGVMKDLSAVLSGYLGDASLGEVELEAVSIAREYNPDLVYCCDPVMGDVGRGFFVKDDIPPFFKDNVEYTDILTPNQFELSALTGKEVTTLDDVLQACQTLVDLGTRYVLVTSVETRDTPSDSIQMLLYSAKGKWIVTTPKIAFDTPPNGAGDMTTAVFLGHMQSGETPENALALTASAIYGVFEKTKSMGRRELAIVQAQDCFKLTNAMYSAEAL